MEPSRCCISSIALVLLKTGIVHQPPAPSGEHPVTIDYNQMATAQKLLLFWRKPAVGLSRGRIYPFSHDCFPQRKCWWDGLEVDLAQPGEPTQPVKLWARRVWTLELSLVSVSLPDLQVHAC